VSIEIHLPGGIWGATSKDKRLFWNWT